MTTFIRTLAIAALALAWSFVPALARAACSTSAGSLTGSYAMLVSGTTSIPASGPKYQAGTVTFDGVSKFSGSNLYSGGATASAVTGTYAANTDCTLTLNATVAGTTSTYTVALQGTGEAVGIEVDAGGLAAIDLTPQFAAGSSSTPFGIGSINGSFVTACIGPALNFSDLNVFTFANGVLNGTDPYNNAGSFATANFPYSGTYSVNTDGTFAGTLQVGGNSAFFDFYGVASNSGTKLQYIYTNAGSLGGPPTGGAFQSCSGSTTTPPTIVTPTPQTITFNTIPSQTVGTPLTLTATASSGLPVSYATSTPTVCAVSGTSATFAAAGSCTITASQAGNATYAAATPVSQTFNVAVGSTGGGVTPVSLTASDNRSAIANPGTANGGIGNDHYSYAANLLGTTVVWNGETFNLGGPGAPSATTSTTIALPSGSFTSLSLLGTGIYGAQLNQTFVVTYTDNTTSSFVQSLSDWGASKGFAGESIAATTAYRVIPSGATQAGPWNLYGYSFALNGAKTVKSLTLPANTNVVVLAIDLSTGATLKSQTITFPAIATQTVGQNLALSATASSNLAVTFASTSTSVCTVSGTTATFVSAGSCSIVASQAGNATYAAAAPVTQTFTVAAAPAGSFKVTASLPIVVVQPPVCIFIFCFGGLPGSDTFTVSPSNGFSGTVALSVSGLPAGVSATFSKSSILTSGSSVLTLSAAAGTPTLRSATLTIKGVSGSLSSSATVTLDY